MKFEVSFQDLITQIGIDNIDFDKNVTNISGSTFISLKEPIDIGEHPGTAKVFSMSINVEEDNISLVVLNLCLNSNDLQSVWTNILQEGFLDLELYPIMVDDLNKPIHLYLAPIRY